MHTFLTIPDPRTETIFGVVGRMEVVRTYLHDIQQHNLVPFLETYYRVTKRVAEKHLQEPRYFNNPKDLHALDAYFASLYFKPLECHLSGNPIPQPWQTYFAYCSQPKGIPFVQMLLGINAHINADLPRSLIDLKYRNHHDFFVINTLLEETLPEVMHFLAFHEHDIFGLGGVVLKNFVNNEFHKIVVSWRKHAWQRADITRHENRQRAVLASAQQAEIIGEKIIKIFKNPLLRPQTTLNQIHSLLD